MKKWVLQRVETKPFLIFETRLSPIDPSYLIVFELELIWINGLSTLYLSLLECKCFSKVGKYVCNTWIVTTAMSTNYIRDKYKAYSNEALNSFWNTTPSEYFEKLNMMNLPSAVNTPSTIYVLHSASAIKLLIYRGKLTIKEKYKAYQK